MAETFNFRCGYTSPDFYFFFNKTSTVTFEVVGELRSALV